jgi:hypothetical protein
MLEERKLGTNPWFKKPLAIGEKVPKALDKKEDLIWEGVDIKA